MARGTKAAPEGAAASLTTIAVVIGTLHTPDGEFGPGSVLEIDAAEAVRLAALGLVAVAAGDPAAEEAPAE